MSDAGRTSIRAIFGRSCPQAPDRVRTVGAVGSRADADVRGCQRHWRAHPGQSVIRVAAHGLRIDLPAPAGTGRNGSSHRHDMVMASVPKGAAGCVGSIDVRAPDAPPARACTSHLIHASSAAAGAPAYTTGGSRNSRPWSAPWEPCPTYALTRASSDGSRSVSSQAPSPHRPAAAAAGGNSPPPPGTSPPPGNPQPPAAGTDTTPPTFAGLQSASTASVVRNGRPKRRRTRSSGRPPPITSRPARRSSTTCSCPTAPVARTSRTRLGRRRPVSPPTRLPICLPKALTSLCARAIKRKRGPEQSRARRRRSLPLALLLLALLAAGYELLS